MQKNKKATSIIEAMIVMLIIVVGVMGLYSIFNESRKLSNTTKNRIEAIEIAKEGIEAMKNIRDTNWIMFAGDKQNCWNTYNYDQNCFGGGGNKILNNKSYTIYQDKSKNYKWYLNKPSISGNYEFKNSIYRDKFRVYQNNGFYTQTGLTNPTIFTREIKINNQTSTGIYFSSIVQWADSSGTHKVKLENLISNWKQD